MKNADQQSELQARTAEHYDRYPFEFMTPSDESAIRATQPEPFRRFVDQYVTATSRVAEIGCGPGRGTLFLLDKTAHLIAVDISYRSLVMARQRTPYTAFIRATNLMLPFQSDSFDVVISDGVIHHTPDARQAFGENARIAAVGGTLYIGVYNRKRYYYYFYTVLGPLLQRLERNIAGRAFIYATALPLYWLVHLVKSGGKRTWKGAINFFYDYIMTPRASFHTYEEVCIWGREEGLDLLAYDPSLGNVHVFVFRKTRRTRTEVISAYSQGDSDADHFKANLHELD